MHARTHARTLVDSIMAQLLMAIIIFITSADSKFCIFIYVTLDNVIHL